MRSGRTVPEFISGSSDSDNLRLHLKLEKTFLSFKPEQ